MEKTEGESTGDLQGMAALIAHLQTELRQCQQALAAAQQQEGALRQQLTAHRRLGTALARVVLTRELTQLPKVLVETAARIPWAGRSAVYLRPTMATAKLDTDPVVKLGGPVFLREREVAEQTFQEQQPRLVMVDEGSVLSIPLVTRDEILGVLLLSTTVPAAFEGSYLIEPLMTLGMVSAVFIDIMRLLQVRPLIPDRVINEAPLLNPQEGMQGQRLEAVTLFVDLASSTAFVDQNSPEVVWPAIRAIITHICLCAQAFGGTIEESRGDAIVTLFTGENRWIRAVSAALMARDTVQTVYDRLESHCRLQFRLAVTDQQLMAGPLGIPADVDATQTPQQTWSILGSGPNLGSRLQDEVGPLQVVVDEATCGYLGDEFIIKPLGPYTLKGFERRGPIPAFLVVGRAPLHEEF